jgi:ubiquinone/menaquinone biosynthesis C-methylase UbiE
MKTYYTARQAKSYHHTWKRFTQKTLAAACSGIDFQRLQQRAREQDQPLRILDVACGTGVLLYELSIHLPQADLYGIDASQTMLTQARLLLRNRPHIHLSPATLVGEPGAGLPYEHASFDLITCTNALHYLPDPITILRELGKLLKPGGQLIVEDYARRRFPFPWPVFERLIKRIDPQHIRAYTLDEAQHLCQQAGLLILTARYFPIDFLWQGWVILAQPDAS